MLQTYHQSPIFDWSGSNTYLSGQALVVCSVQVRSAGSHLGSQLISEDGVVDPDKVHGAGVGEGARLVETKVSLRKNKRT